MQGDMPIDPNLARVEELWFDDGGTIIQAETCIFRVSRAILAARSLIFKDIFTAPQSPPSESMDGCPIVRLTDSAADVTVFFKAIFDSEFFEPYPARTDLNAIIGVLRLSHKYDVAYLRRRALVHLSSGYRTVPPVIHEDTYLPTDGSWAPPSSASDFIRLIHLAREVSSPWILPPVFYTLTADFGTPEVAGNVLFHDLLSEDDRQKFLHGASLQASCVLDALCFLYEPATITGCTGPAGACAVERLHALKHVRVGLKAHRANPLHIFQFEPGSPVMGVCAVCFETLLDAYNQGRRAIWAQLPEMYGLPEWAELEQMRAAAVG
ncbi:hypothetical protein DFH07DRAFT_859833 [Mycena maculata]|uniref:BTB domain-containing protein n=1 Tax=Mycena maculata TaxID=230809 RepID=A0AAD7HEL7_9AGAR|nr:hypothetical protein DFH07DRAFT_859833 [Mycena maculata]